MERGPGGEVDLQAEIAMRPPAEFAFEALVEWWATTLGIQAAWPSIRGFFTVKAATITAHLPDNQLHWALAAWQREGEQLYAKRYMRHAAGVYEELRDLLLPHSPLLSLWCEGARAECLIQTGEIEAGLAALREVQRQFSAAGYRPAIDALQQTIDEALPYLDAPPERRPRSFDPVDRDASALELTHPPVDLSMPDLEMFPRAKEIGERGEK